MHIEQMYRFDRRLIDEKLLTDLYRLVLDFLESTGEGIDDLILDLVFSERTFKMEKLEFDKFTFPNDKIERFLFFHTSITISSYQNEILCSVKKHEERSNHLFYQVKQILDDKRSQEEVSGSTLNAEGIKVITKDFTGKVLTEKEIQNIYTKLQEFLWKTNPSSNLGFEISTHKGEQFNGDSFGQLTNVMPKITDYVTVLSLSSLPEVSFRYSSYPFGCNLFYEIKGNEKMVEDIGYQLNGILLNAKDIPLVSKIVSKAGYVSIIGFFVTWGWTRRMPEINGALTWVLLGLNVIWGFGIILLMRKGKIFPAIELDLPGFKNDNKNYPKYNRRTVTRIIAFIVTAICLPILINMISDLLNK